MRLNHILSFLCLLIFFLSAVSSIGVHKLHCGDFEQLPTYKHSKKGQANFIVKNDGTRIEGDKIFVSSGVISTHSISIDGVKYEINEIKGYQEGGVYYARFHGRYLKRIIEGKLNVYYETNEKMDCFYYAQRGEDGEITGIDDPDDIKEFVKDCSKSYEMLNKSKKQIRAAIRSEANFLTSVFEIYNNGCNN